MQYEMLTNYMYRQFLVYAGFRQLAKHIFAGAVWPCFTGFNHHVVKTQHTCHNRFIRIEDVYQTSSAVECQIVNGYGVNIIFPTVN